MIGFRLLFSIGKLKKGETTLGEKRTKSKAHESTPDQDSSCYFHYTDIPNFCAKQRIGEGEIKRAQNSLSQSGKSLFQQSQF